MSATSPAAIRWTIGVELELLAPSGSSRRTLAEHYARAASGRVRPFFHPQSELSAVPDTPVFENLTLGFEALDAADAPIARCVDDLTLVDDLDHERPPLPGWFRVISDDTRFLNLVMRHGRADAFTLEAVAPIADLYGTTPDQFPGGTVRVVDRNGSPICIATPLPGERERPCEIVTPPLAHDHGPRLDALLAPARDLGFTLPKESATHIHFDGAVFRNPRAFRNLVRLVETWAPALKSLVDTNPRCRRLGAWPAELHTVVESPDFVDQPWPAAQESLKELGLTKYCDVNVKNIVHDIPDKPTIEIRILPGMRDTQPILEAAALFEALLRHAVDTTEIERTRPAHSARALVDRLPLAADMRAHWLAKL